MFAVMSVRELLTDFYESEFICAQKSDPDITIYFFETCHMVPESFAISFRNYFDMVGTGVQLSIRFSSRFCLSTMKLNVLLV